MAEQFYTINETCELLKVTRKTVYTWINEGRLQAVRVGSRYRISESAIEDFTTNRSLDNIKTVDDIADELTDTAPFIITEK